MKKIIFLILLLGIVLNLFGLGARTATIFMQRWLALTDSLQVDGNVYFNSNIRMANGEYFQARNNGDSAYDNLFSYNTSDEIDIHQPINVNLTDLGTDSGMVLREYMGVTDTDTHGFYGLLGDKIPYKTYVTGLGTGSVEDVTWEIPYKLLVGSNQGYTTDEGIAFGAGDDYFYQADASTLTLAINGSSAMNWGAGIIYVYRNLYPSATMAKSLGSTTIYWSEGFIGDDPDNTECEALHLLNGDEPLTTETGQSASIEFQVMGTDDSGSTYTIQEAGKIEAYKVGDYFGSDETDFDSGLRLKTVVNGSYVQALSVQANDAYVTDDLFVADDLVVTGMAGNNAQQTTTLAVGATTFAVTNNVIQVTGDGGGNTIGTITAAITGIYTFIFVDANITITDTDAHTADTVDLAGTATNLTSADDLVLTLVYDGTSWYEMSRSAN